MTINFKVPFQYDRNQGYFAMHSDTDLEGAIVSDLKMLMNMNKGENLMHPDMGMDFRSLVFENFSSEQELADIIKTRISEQLNIWMPFVKLVTFDVPSVSNLGGRGVNIEYKSEFAVSTNKYLKILLNDFIIIV